MNRFAAFEGLSGAPANLSPLLLHSFTITPAIANLSQATSVAVNATGGTGPLTYAFTNLPIGCASQNLSQFLCFPSEVEHYVVAVQVTDVVGDVVSASANLTVESGHGSPPTVTSFVVSPATVKEYQRTYLTVVAVSHSSTPSAFLTYAFVDLPLGCGSFNQTNLTCLPAQSGTFTVGVEVTDGFGAIALAHATLRVVSAGASGGSTAPSWTTPAVIGVVIVAVAAVAFLGWRTRRKV